MKSYNDLHIGSHPRLRGVRYELRFRDYGRQYLPPEAWSATECRSRVVSDDPRHPASSRRRSMVTSDIYSGTCRFDSRWLIPALRLPLDYFFRSFTGPVSPNYHFTAQSSPTRRERQ